MSQVRQQLGQSYQPWINGEFVSTQGTAQSLNPSNPDEVVGTVGLISIEQADEAVATAKAAFTAWRQTPVAERAGILRKAAELMEQRRHELNAWMVLEVGKPLRECDGEVSEAIDRFLSLLRLGDGTSARGDGLRYPR